MGTGVFLGIGHGGSDPGAVGYVREADVNLTMGMACREYLIANGVRVGISRTGNENDPVSEEAKECNAFNPAIAMDIHNNAGGGDGFEAICSILGGAGRELAKLIEEEVKKIGQNSRGIKTRKNSAGKDYFAFIRLTNCPAVICEGAFVDNANDVKIIDTVAEQREFGYAYARAAMRYLGVSGNKVPSNPAQAGSFLVKVLVPDLTIRAGAGMNTKAVGHIKDKGTYTIVEVKYNGSTPWGRLKSGVGYISLVDKYVKRV